MLFDSFIDTLLSHFRGTHHQNASSSEADQQRTAAVQGGSTAITSLPQSSVVSQNQPNITKKVSIADGHPGKKRRRANSDGHPGKKRRRANSDGHPGKKSRRANSEGYSSKRQRHDHSVPSVIDSESSATKPSSLLPFGNFNNAHDFVSNNPQFVEMILTGKTVLETLDPYTLPEATMDSSARHPPPECHPGTRTQTREKLEEWLDDHDRQWNMMWLFGSAGTGKSAVAQTFGENCAEKHRHGASYFFSRPHKRNKLETVIPTLAYQLAVNCREYKSILAHQLIEDPQLLKKAPRVQLRELIVEPFLRLQIHGHQGVRKPFVIILDGLDECEEDRAQCELVKMISEVVRTKKGLPLVWLICSRPEAHLKHLLSRIPECGREELPIDAQTRDDVKRYLRDEFARIKAEDYVLASLPFWPSDKQLLDILRAVSGLFVFASTVVKYVDDSADANPAQRLDTVVSYLKDARKTGVTNPLAALDILYMRILGDIPDVTFAITWRILAYLIYLPKFSDYLDPAQNLCNFLDIDQHTFYSALHKVYSVVDVPSPEDAGETPLRFYHTSFRDFLVDPNRSGKFVTEKHRAMTDIAKSCLFWHGIDTTLFHTNDDWDFDDDHNHDTLPGLKWSSTGNEEAISNAVATYIGHSYSSIFYYLSEAERDDALLFQVYNFDFRYIQCSWELCFMVNWIHRQDPSTTFVRTEPSSKVDFELLQYMKVVTNEDRVKPARFPLTWNEVKLGPGYCKYFFMGQGAKSVIVWVVGGRKGEDIWLLNADKEPSNEMISAFQDRLDKIEWPGYDSAADKDGETQ